MQVGVLVGGNVGAEFGWFSKAKANQSVGGSTWDNGKNAGGGTSNGCNQGRAGQGKNKQESEGEFRATICTRAS